MVTKVTAANIQDKITTGVVSGEQLAELAGGKYLCCESRFRWYSEWQRMSHKCARIWDMIRYVSGMTKINSNGSKEITTISTSMLTVGTYKSRNFTTHNNQPKRTYCE